MDLKILLDKQKELDKTILKNAGLKEYPLNDMRLALLVELGELVNEWQGFKHWKKHKKINREKLLEEFADCFSFALSLENHLHQVEPPFIKKINKIVKDTDNAKDVDKDLTIGFIYAFESIPDDFTDMSILLNIIALGRCLDISLDEMQEAYLKKNKINWQRQKEGY